MADENIVDILNDGGDYMVDDDTSIETEYTPIQEGANRGAASKMVQKIAKVSNQNSGGNSEIQNIIKQNQALMDKVNKLESKLNGVETTATELRGEQDKSKFKMLTDDILRQEEELLNDPVNGQFFNRDKVRPEMYKYWKGDPDKGIDAKDLTPYEVNAIVNYPELARENLAYKKKFAEINANRNMSFASEAHSNAEVDDFADVRNAPKGSKLTAARELAMKRAGRLY